MRFLQNVTMILSMLGLFWCCSIEAKNTKKSNNVIMSDTQVAELGILYSTRLEEIQVSLAQNKLSSAIYYTTLLKEKLVHDQIQQLDALFPSNTAGFKAEPYRNQARGIGLNGESFGVVLSKRYSNDEGHYIELLVVNDSDAISEYQLLIKRPNLIEELQDARLIKLQSYMAIEKWLPEPKIIEQNILINTNLMINIFAKGVENPEVISNFLEKIPFKEIESHLKN